MPNSQKQSPQNSSNNSLMSELVQGYWRLNEWNMSPQQRLTFLKQHIELGVTTVDHAYVYGGSTPCESTFSEALNLEPSIRNKIQIISKCGINQVQHEKQVTHYSNQYDDILESVDTSLTRLNVDHLDIMLLHRPDWLMDADEVARAFAQLKQSGKVSNFGVSNFSSSQFSLLQSRLDQPLVTNQVEINPINFDVINDGTLDLLQQLNIRPMAWSCLAGGAIFTDKNEKTLRLKQTLTEIVFELNLESIEQVIYAWIKKLPSKPLLVLGSGNIQRTKLAVDSLEYHLTQEQWYRIWVAAKGYGVA